MFTIILLATVLQNGQTPLAIAQRLGYISVVEILKPVTEVQGIAPATEDKYKVVSPETMQEAFISDSEDEGGNIHACTNISLIFLHAEFFLKVKYT